MRNKLAQKIKLGAALLLMAGTSAFAQTSNQTYTPTPENIKARQEFQDNKFGIFLHWGIYSMTAQGEWYINTHNIYLNEYAKLSWCLLVIQIYLAPEVLMAETHSAASKREG